jgi:hypothetical protein
MGATDFDLRLAMPRLQLLSIGTSSPELIDFYCHCTHPVQADQNWLFTKVLLISTLAHYQSRWAA